MLLGGGTTMSTLQDVLKNFYIGPIKENLNQATVLLAQLKKSSKEVVGEQVILPIHIGRNWGVGARGTAGTGTLPTARNQQYDKTYFTTKDVYGRILISGKTIRATKTDKGAFLRVVKSETEGMVKDLSSDINRQLYGSGNGVLATVTGNATSATVTVDSTQYLEEGMYVDINNDTGVVISTIDSATTFTLSGSITSAIGEYVRITGVGATDELNGLDLITLNTTSLENIDPATVTMWKGNVFGDDSNPIALKEWDMQQVVDACEKKGGKIDLIVTSYGGYAKFASLLMSQKRFTAPNLTKLKGGFSFIDYNDIALVKDRHCQEDSTKTRMYMLSLDSLGIYRMADFEWAQEDGAILARQVGASAQEAYEGTLVCDMEFATTARRHNGVLKGISLA
jgi:hypothetical protein